ncbi:adhesion G-protein coupled receptor G2-like isoform X2 [Mustelus asterias]
MQSDGKHNGNKCKMKDHKFKNICKRFHGQACNRRHYGQACNRADDDQACSFLCDKANEQLNASNLEEIINNVQECNRRERRKEKWKRRCLERLLGCSISGDSVTRVNQNMKFYSRISSISEFKPIKLIANSSWVGEKNSDSKNFDFEVDLPAELSKKAKEQLNDLSRITLIIHNDTSLFEDVNNTDLISGDVYEITVGNTSIQNLSELVTLTISHNEKTRNKSSQQCVFLYENEDENATDEWKSTGCTTTVQDTQTICRCNHLSYFAVLLNFGEEEALDEGVLMSLIYITQIGCGISAVFSAITIILYCTFRKIKSDHITKIHMNLCAALFLLNINFLTNVWLSMVKNDGFCKTIAVCLHYSLLCTFTWMGIEAFQLYLMLIKVFNTYIKYYMQKLAVVGWGIPAIVVFVCIGVNKDNYGWFSIETQDRNNTVSMCWITNEVVHYVTNCGYFSVVCFGNTVMLITTCAKLICLRRQSSNEQRSVWKDLWTVLGLCCLLGTTWALAFFSFRPLHVVQMYLFSILNSLQGFFIFLWYCALKRPSKEEISSFTTTLKD